MDQTVQAAEPEREKKPVAELERGTWINVIDQDGDWLGEARVLHVETYEEQTLGRRAVLVYQIPGWNPETLRCDAEMTMPLLTGEEVKEREASAERARQIAGIRSIVDWLEANPWLPIADLDVNRHLSGPDGYRTLVETAERLGAKLDTRLNDRTKFVFCKGPLTYTVLAWHDGGRPVEPAPEPVAEDLGAGFDSSQMADADATPVPSSRRYELHTGAMTDGGLVDETPELMPSGLTKAADESRGVLAGTTPVVTYFSFGDGHRDPDTGKDLWRHYVTVVAPTYEACREAMFASRYGREWGMDYLAGTARALKSVPRWTEHEVIVAPGTDQTAADRALAAAMRVLADEPMSEPR